VLAKYPAVSTFFLKLPLPEEGNFWPSFSMVTGNLNIGYQI
jgi:hypothetical protein